MTRPNTKRIFNKSMADYLCRKGVKFIEARKGEVPNKPDRVVFIFENSFQLKTAMDEYKTFNKY